jgi:hypothetical protein
MVKIAIIIWRKSIIRFTFPLRCHYFLASPRGVPVVLCNNYCSNGPANVEEQYLKFRVFISHTILFI